jgi:hypothetical protein
MSHRLALSLLLCPAVLLAVPVPEKPLPPPAPEHLREALGAVLNGTRPLESVRIRAVRWGAPKEKSVTLFGDGLAIIDGDKQARVRRDRVIRVLRLLHEQQLLWLGRDRDVSPGSADQQSGLIEVSVQGVSLVRRGLDADKPVESLLRLVSELRELVNPQAHDVRIAPSLADGLEQVRRGSLDPRTLKVFAVWSNPEGERIGVCVRWNTCEAHVRQDGQPSWTQGASKTIELTSAEVRSVRQLLQDNNSEQLPERVIARALTSSHLLVTVLGQQRKVTVEPIADEGNVDLPEKSQNLDNILAYLEILAQRTLKEGK